MRGVKKLVTQQKLDRSRVLPFYLTKTQIALYEQDIYKYLIHLLKVFPTDEFHVLQFLLLQFHPLILRVCRKFNAKKIQLDWTDLISFARYSFVELVYRFNLESTLYFKTFIPLALDRAVNDYLIYDLRRKSLFNAVRLDQIPAFERDALMREHIDVTNTGADEGELEAGSLKDYREECIHFVERHQDIALEDKDIFLEHFLRGRDLVSIAKQKQLPLDNVRRRVNSVLEEVKQHIRDNFL